MYNELGRLSQGYGEKGTDGYLKRYEHSFIDGFGQNKKNQKDQVVTYAQIVVDNWPQKRPKSCENNRGGDLIKYHFELTLHMTDISTSKVIWNFTISTCGVRCMCAQKFYLATPLDCPEYTKIPVGMVPLEFIAANNLASKIKNLYIYMKNNTRNLRFTTIRCFSQQTTEKTTRRTWLLRSWPHTRTFHSQDAPNMVYTCSRWFRSEIRW